MKNTRLLSIGLVCLVLAGCSKAKPSPLYPAYIPVPVFPDPFFYPAFQYISQYENGNVTEADDQTYDFSLTLPGYSPPNATIRPYEVDSIAIQGLYQIFAGIDENTITKSISAFNFKVAHEQDSIVYMYHYSLRYDFAFAGVWIRWPWNNTQ
jgi:hypothetical protein